MASQISPEENSPKTSLNRGFSEVEGEPAGTYVFQKGPSDGIATGHKGESDTNSAPRRALKKLDMGLARLLASQAHRVTLSNLHPTMPRSSSVARACIRQPKLLRNMGHAHAPGQRDLVARLLCLGWIAALAVSGLLRLFS